MAGVFMGRVFGASVQNAFESRVASAFIKGMSQASDAYTAKGMGDDVMKTMQGKKTPEELGKSYVTNVATGGAGILLGRMASVPFQGPARESVASLTGTMTGLFFSGVTAQK